VAEPFRAERTQILRLSGDIDENNWESVADRITDQVRSGAERLDLTGVTHFGAAGVRAVLVARESLPDGAMLELRCGPAVHRVMRVCGLDDMPGLVVTRSGAAG
jgi:anti-anti-sigma factor